MFQYEPNIYITKIQALRHINLRLRRDYARNTHRRECCCAPLKGYRVRRKQKVPGRNTGGYIIGPLHRP